MTSSGLFIVLWSRELFRYGVRTRARLNVRGYVAKFLP